MGLLLHKGGKKKIKEHAQSERRSKNEDTAGRKGRGTRKKGIEFAGPWKK